MEQRRVLPHRPRAGLNPASTPLTVYGSRLAGDCLCAVNQTCALFASPARILLTYKYPYMWESNLYIEILPRQGL